MNARRIASLAGTVAVTVVAAIGSYDHMRELALEAGQTPFLATLLPLSVDGMILVATLALGDGRRSRWSAWLAFLVGVAASLAANVIVAAPDVVSRVVSAWPAVALLLTVEVLARSGKGGQVAAVVPAEVAGTVMPQRETPLEGPEVSTPTATPAVAPEGPTVAPGGPVAPEGSPPGGGNPEACCRHAGGTRHHAGERGGNPRDHSPEAPPGAQRARYRVTGVTLSFAGGNAT